MKLKLIAAISIALLSGTAMATEPLSSNAATGWTQTDENGGFTQTMTLKGKTKIVLLPWMWKLGDGNPKTADGKDLFKLGSYQFKKGTDMALANQGSAGATGKYSYAKISPSEPIDLISGYTQKPFAQGKAGITPEITIQDAENNEVKLTYGTSLQKINIKATGTPQPDSSNGGDIDGVLQINVGSGLSVITHSVRYGANYNYGQYDGINSFQTKTQDILKNEYSDYSSQYGAGYTYTGGASAQGLLLGQNTQDGGAPTNISGSVYAGIDNLTMIWTGDELPASWTAPVKITVTMI